MQQANPIDGRDGPPSLVHLQKISVSEIGKVGALRKKLHAVTGYLLPYSRNVFSSLRVRLLAIALLAVFPGLGLAVYSNWQLPRRAGSVEIDSAARAIALLAADNLERAVEESRQLLFLLGHLPEVRGSKPTACSALMASLLKQYPNYVNFGAVKPDGKIWCSGLDLAESVAVVDRPWFERAKRDRTFSIGEYERELAANKAVLTFSYPLLDGKGEVKIILFAALDLESLNREAAKAGRFAKRPYTPGTVVTAVDRRGTILARYPEPQKWLGRSLPDEALLGAVLSEKQDTTEVVWVDGGECCHAFKRVKGDRSLTALAKIAKTESLAEINPQRAATLSAAALGLVLAIAAFRWRVRARDKATAPTEPAPREELDRLADVRESPGGSRCSASLMATIPVGITLVNRDRQIAFVNDRAEQILGMSKQELCGKTYKSLNWQTSDSGIAMPNAELPFQLVIATRQPAWDSRHALEWPNGRRVFLSIDAAPLLDADGQVEAVVFAIHDITQQHQAEAEFKKAKQELEQKFADRTAELKKAFEQLRQELQERQRSEAALQESQRFIQKITDATPNIIYVYDLNEQCNIYCNRELTAILGYTPQEIQQMGSQLLKKLVHPEDLPHVLEHYQRFATAKEGESLEIEYRARHVSGAWHWLLSRDIVFARTAEGKPRHILGTASDITKRKQVEEALQLANQQLTNWVNELEVHKRELAQLRELSEVLQACLTVEEAYNQLAQLVQPLFPDLGGGVFVISASRTLVEAVATWNSFEAENSLFSSQNLFAPHKCWGLRRGRAHLVEDSHSGLPCAHQHGANQPAQSYCVPMMAQGEALGLLYLSSPQLGRLTKDKQLLAVTVAEQIALALANLKLRETLQQQSIRDPLTGLFNRRYLEESLEREINRASRSQQPLGAIMIDVDHFKQFNDSFGHEAGDLVLRELALFVRQHVRECDIVCRYGGEELTLILPGASLDIAKQRAEQLRSGVKQLHLEYRQQPIGAISISLGVAAFPEHGLTGDEVIGAADAALYRAKTQGRDRVTVAPT